MQVGAEIRKVHSCTKETDVTFAIISCLTIFAAFSVPVRCGVVGVNGTGAISELKNVSVPTPVTSIIPESTTLDKESRESLDYYYNYDSKENSAREEAHWEERERRKPEGHKVAQVIVYFSVIFIALAGVLIRYFVTQYETSQMKAHEQLNYQRLQDQQL